MKSLGVIFIVLISLLVISKESIGVEDVTLNDVIDYISEISEGHTEPTIKQYPLGNWMVSCNIIFIPIKGYADYAKKQESILKQIELFSKKGLLRYETIQFVDINFSQMDRIEAKIDAIAEEMQNK